MTVRRTIAELDIGIHGIVCICSHLDSDIFNSSVERTATVIRLHSFGHVQRTQDDKLPKRIVSVSRKESVTTREI